MVFCTHKFKQRRPLAQIAPSVRSAFEHKLTLQEMSGKIGLVKLFH